MKKKYYSDLERLRRLKDEEIDTSDIPELDASFFEKAVIAMPKPKAAVCIRLDQDVLEWFKSQGKGLSDPDKRPAAGVYGGTGE